MKTLSQSSCGRLRPLLFILSLSLLPIFEACKPPAPKLNAVPLPSKSIDTPSPKTSLRPAPKLTLRAKNGSTQSLEDFRGKWVLLHFWAGWCSPCRSEIPEWIELGARLNNKKIQFIAVSLDTNWEDAEKILPLDKIPGRVLSFLDTTGKTPESFGTFQFPETYLINPESKIITKWVGPQSWSSQSMNIFFSKLLN
jgi:thiol-disulfide isomerase/thioredoxin